MDTQNSQKKSPRSSAKNERQPRAAGAHPGPAQEDEDPYFDRAPDLVARIRQAKEAAQREMESFGDISEYEVTVLQGQLKVSSAKSAQAALEFEISEESEAD